MTRSASLRHGSSPGPNVRGSRENSASWSAGDQPQRQSDGISSATHGCRTTLVGPHHRMRPTPLHPSQPACKVSLLPGCLGDHLLNDSAVVQARPQSQFKKSISRDGGRLSLCSWLRAPPWTSFFGLRSRSSLFSFFSRASELSFCSAISHSSYQFNVIGNSSLGRFTYQRWSNFKIARFGRTESSQIVSRARSLARPIEIFRQRKVSVLRRVFEIEHSRENRVFGDHRF